MIWFAVIAALVSAVQTFSASEARRRQMEYQAKVETANASAKRQEAEITRKEAVAEQRAADARQERVKRAYKAEAGENRSLLAAGNVDITRGSALNLLQGNANRFADDMGEMEFEEAMQQWSYKNKAGYQEWEADVHDSNASYLKSAAGSTGGSLLSAGLAGGASFASSYFLSGGFSSAASSTASESASSLAGSQAGNPKWETLRWKYGIN